MATFTLGILEAGENRPEFQSDHGDYSDWFERALTNGSEQPMSFKRYAAHLGTLPERADDCDGYIITGSRHSVLERAEWMQATKALVLEAAEDRPVIGVCFGHQLIAEAFGGRVEEAPTGWNVGVQSYEITMQKPWMTPVQERIGILSSNVDQVMEAPEGAEVLATSETCPIAMMQIGGNVLTLQPHPEATKPLMELVYRLRYDQIGPSKADAALSSLADPAHGDLVSGWFRTFLAR